MRAAPILSLVDADAVARLTADENASRKAGFALKPPVYELGTIVNETGVENFRKARADYEALPYAWDALNRLIDKVGSENRQDVVTHLNAMDMQVDGSLAYSVRNGWARGNGMLPLEERAFQSLAQMVTPGGAAYLSACPPRLRCDHLNYWTARAKEDRKATLRTRDAGNGERSIFACVSERYAAHDVDKVAQQIADALPGGSRADVTYDGYRARVNVLFHTTVEPARAAAGEIFRAGLCITTDDTGRGAIRVEAEVWRNLCRNLIILDSSKLKIASRRHRGNATIADDVRSAIAQAQNAVSYFSDAWNVASVENVLERYGVDDVATIFRQLAESKIVHAPGVKPDAMAERLQRAWDQEPGYSKTAIVNAITRSAHEDPWATPWVTEDLERTAGELLFAKVWNVQTTSGSVA
jgi:hypothetical protein